MKPYIHLSVRSIKYTSKAPCLAKVPSSIVRSPPARSGLPSACRSMLPAARPPAPRPARCAFSAALCSARHGFCAFAHCVLYNYINTIIKQAKRQVKSADDVPIPLLTSILMAYFKDSHDLFFMNSHGRIFLTFCLRPDDAAFPFLFPFSSLSFLPYDSLRVT